MVSLNGHFDSSYVLKVGYIFIVYELKHDIGMLKHVMSCKNNYQRILTGSNISVKR